jgi:biofilm PGA synthesis N-glycosyltransferase PgaC
MLFQQFLILFFLTSVVFGLLLTTFNLVGASLYELGEVRKQKQLALHPHTRRFRHRPLISVIVPAHNEESVIERCLQSIVDSTYRKYEIIVVDDASSDNTSQIVKEFKARYPKKTIRLITKRKNAGRGGAINAGFDKWAKGELIMALDADSTVDKRALKNIANQFALNDISALAANVRVMQHPSIIGLVQQFEYLTAFRSKKFNTLSYSEYIIGGSGAVYQRSVFEQLKGFNEAMWTEDIALSLAIAKLGNKQFRLFYASNVLVFTEPVPSYRSLFLQRYRWKLGSLQALFEHKQLFFATDKKYTKLLAWMRLPLVIFGEIMLLLEPFLLTYFIYLAINFQNGTLYLVSWLTICGLLMFAVWGDEFLPREQKSRLTFYVPIMYGLFYIMAFIQIAAMIKCLFNFKKITGKQAIRGSWQPPERIASQA